MTEYLSIIALVLAASMASAGFMLGAIYYLLKRDPEIPKAALCIFFLFVSLLFGIGAARLLQPM